MMGEDLPIPTYTKIMIILLTRSRQFLVRMGLCFSQGARSLLLPLNILSQPLLPQRDRLPLRRWRAVNFHWFRDTLSS